jgi:hypothetical protein
VTVFGDRALKEVIEPGMVVFPYNTSYSGDGDKIAVQG